MQNDMTDRLINEVAKEIQQSAIFSSDRVKASMNLPAVTQVDNETLTLALQIVLEKMFRIAFPNDQMMHVRVGRSVKFIDIEDGDLPPRRVSVLLNPEYRTVEVVGVEAENGKDGYADVKFQWQKQAGHVDSLGNIDLKRLNKYPSVNAGDTLAVIYFQTMGKPGIEATGKKIKQRLGKPLKVKFTDVNILRQQQSEESAKYSLIARRSGIVDFLLQKREDPRSLAKIDILDTITINGDVDYTIGNQGSLTDKSMSCTSNIEVKGSVLGVFSLQSTGFIHVSGAIEGKKVIADEVVATTVTSGSTILGRKECVVDNAIRAKIEGANITLKKNSNESEFIASDTLFLSKNASCMGLKIRTHRLVSEKNRFSGRTCIQLGEELFNEEKELLHRKEIAAAEMGKNVSEIKEAFKVVIEQLGGLEAFVKKSLPSIPPPISSLFAGIKKILVQSLQQLHKPLHENMIPACYRLQQLLGDANIHESILRKVEVVIGSLKKLNEILLEQQERYQRLQKIDEKIHADQEQARALQCEFDAPQFIGSNSEMTFVCGEQQLALSSENIPFKKFNVSYKLKADAADLSGGKLVVEESLGNF